jgi:hypothetical protein
MEFPIDKFKPKNDRFVKSRDGNSKFLYLTCNNCHVPVMIYQKDGKGGLLRCYVDRIFWPLDLAEKYANQLVCSSCNNVIGNSMIYEPEKRPAYRLIPGTVHIYRSPEQALKI